LPFARLATLHLHQYSPVRVPIVVRELENHFFAVKILVRILVGEALLSMVVIVAKFRQNACFLARLPIYRPLAYWVYFGYLGASEAGVGAHIMLTVEDFDIISLLEVDFIVLCSHLELTQIVLIHWKRTMDAQGLR